MYGTKAWVVFALGVASLVAWFRESKRNHMASVERRSDEAWYVRLGDTKIACALFGPADEGRLALMRRIVGAVAAEAQTAKPRGRPPKAASPDVDAVVAAAVRAAVAAVAPTGSPVPVVAAPAVAQATLPIAAGCPSPSEAVAWYLGTLRHGGRHGKRTFKAARVILTRACREMGGDSWTPWLSTSKDNGTWAWWKALRTLGRKGVDPKPMKHATRLRYHAILHAFREACVSTDATTNDGRPYSAVPDYMPKRYRPDDKTPTEMLQSGETRTETHIAPFTIAEVRSMLRTVDAVGMPDYFRLGTHILAKTGINPADAVVMLTGGGTFEWDRPDGVVWYHGVRTKTAVPIDVPLAPSLAALLRPYRDGLTLRLSTPVANVESWDYHFARLCGLAKIAPTKGKAMGRFRHTFNSAMENTLGVPESNREALMSHRLRKAGRINTHYTHAEQALMVKAVRDFDALIAPVAQTAGRATA
jgi:integrase